MITFLYLIASSWCYPTYGWSGAGLSVFAQLRLLCSYLYISVQPSALLLWYRRNWVKISKKKWAYHMQYVSMMSRLNAHLWLQSSDWLLSDVKVFIQRSAKFRTVCNTPFSDTNFLLFYQSSVDSHKCIVISSIRACSAIMKVTHSIGLLRFRLNENWNQHRKKTQETWKTVGWTANKSL